MKAKGIKMEKEHNMRTRELQKVTQVKWENQKQNNE